MEETKIFARCRSILIVQCLLSLVTNTTYHKLDLIVKYCKVYNFFKIYRKRFGFYIKV